MMVLLSRTHKHVPPTTTGGFLLVVVRDAAHPDLYAVHWNADAPVEGAARL